jgi:hypothetical protein
MKKTSRQEVSKFDFPISFFHVFMISCFPVQKMMFSAEEESFHE